MNMDLPLRQLKLHDICKASKTMRAKDEKSNAVAKQGERHR